MGLDLVLEKVIASENQMDIVQMEMEPWLLTLVGTQLAAELQSS